MPFLYDSTSRKIFVVMRVLLVFYLAIACQDKLYLTFKTIALTFDPNKSEVYLINTRKAIHPFPPTCEARVLVKAMLSCDRI